MRTVCFIFSTSAAFSITGIKVMISGIAFDHPDHLSHLRAFPHDCFKFYTIVRIEPNSIQAIEVVSVIRVVYDCSDCLNIIWENGTIGVIIWKPGLKNSCSYQFTHDWPTCDECTLLTECNDGESLILRFKILHNFLWCNKHGFRLIISQNIACAFWSLN